MSAALTRLAIWWLRRHWREVGPPDPFECPVLDASKVRQLVIGPGVIQEPGLLISTVPMSQDEPLQALTTMGRTGDTYTLLGYQAAEKRNGEWVDE